MHTACSEASGDTAASDTHAVMPRHCTVSLFDNFQAVSQPCTCEEVKDCQAASQQRTQVKHKRFKFVLCETIERNTGMLI